MGLGVDVVVGEAVNEIVDVFDGVGDVVIVVDAEIVVEGVPV